MEINPRKKDGSRKPAELCGVESKGMLLAASDGNDNLQVAFVDGMAPGSRVR